MFGIVREHVFQILLLTWIPIHSLCGLEFGGVIFEEQRGRMNMPVGEEESFEKNYQYLDSTART